MSKPNTDWHWQPTPHERDVTTTEWGRHGVRWCQDLDATMQKRRRDGVPTLRAEDAYWLLVEALLKARGEGRP